MYSLGFRIWFCRLVWIRLSVVPEVSLAAKLRSWITYGKFFASPRVKGLVSITNTAG